MQPPQEGDPDVPEVDQAQGQVSYQASSPDEVALVEWAGEQGLCLSARTEARLQVSARPAPVG